MACLEKRSGFDAFTNGGNGEKVIHELPEALEDLW
jgi:hypothetical protein